MIDFTDSANPREIAYFDRGPIDADQLVLGGFPLQKVLTHQLPVDAFQEGFELMESGRSGKVVLDWT